MPGREEAPTAIERVAAAAAVVVGGETSPVTTFSSLRGTMPHFLRNGHASTTATPRLPREETVAGMTARGVGVMMRGTGGGTPAHTTEVTATITAVAATHPATALASAVVAALPLASSSSSRRRRTTLRTMGRQEAEPAAAG